MEVRLKEFNIKYIKRTVEDNENRTSIDQLFFNDPDGFMIEICNCENLKLVPAGSLGKIKLPFDRHYPPVKVNNPPIWIRITNRVELFYLFSLYIDRCSFLVFHSKVLF